MRNIRKLYFQNASGTRYGLNGENGVYASGLSGLGITLSPSFADLCHGFFIPIKEESEPQTPVAFTLFFTKNPYPSYRALVDWLSAAGKFTIVYAPFGAQEYCRDVSISFLQKGELNEVGWLEVPCSLLCHTPWYRPTPTVLTLETNNADEIRMYDYVYDDDLRYGYDSNAPLVGSIYGAGHIPGTLEISCHGALTNPKIRLVGDISGITYGVCSVAAVLTQSDTLQLSTRYENAYVKKIAADGTETDLLDVLDLSLTPFFHIPVDEPCTITVESDEAFAGYAELLIYYYYRSV